MPLSPNLSAINELSKPRITRLVVMTSLVGFLLSAITREWTWSSFVFALVGCVVGTALSSGGANALNQCMEVARDSRMKRTAARPLPSHRISLQLATFAGLVMCAAGLAVLCPLCGPAATVVSGATIVIYLAVYTPLKTVTPLNTWVGAIPGALPPMIGWCAAAWMSTKHAAILDSSAAWAGLQDLAGWSLFGLMAVWQIPHFLAIAWMHRDDYARGGYRMLPLNDPRGGKTTLAMITFAAILVPATILPWWFMPERLSVVYAGLAAATGLAYLALTIWLSRDRTQQRARRVFIASIIHLPVLLAVLVADAVVKHLI